MIEFNTTRDHEDLVVELSGAFTIPYEGSSKLLNELQDFIDKISI
jgi:hypothetical protein